MQMWIQKGTVMLMCFAIVSSATPIQAATYVPSASCSELFKAVRESSMQRAADSLVMNDVTCGAYKFLIDRYEPGTCSARGFSDPKGQGITSLNPDFAVRLATLLVEGEAAVGRFGINSAFRTGGPNGGQACANPRGYGGNTNASPHAQGLAVDLVYPGGGTKHDCSSAGYEWIVANAGRHGIAQYNQVHSFVSGECNHVENTGRVTGGPGPGASSAKTASPTSDFTQAIRQALGYNTQPETRSMNSAQPFFSSQSPIQAFLPQQGISVTTGIPAGVDATAGTQIGVSSQLGWTSGQMTHATTAGDRLEELAFGPKSTSPSHATSVPLIVTGAQAVNISGSQNHATTQPMSIMQISPTQQTQTFISGDLSWQSESSFQSNPVTGWTAVLITVKAALNRILAIMRPLGVHDAIIDQQGEYAE